MSQNYENRPGIILRYVCSNGKLRHDVIIELIVFLLIWLPTLHQCNLLVHRKVNVYLLRRGVCLPFFSIYRVIQRPISVLSERMSSFTESALIKKLMDLNPTQQSKKMTKNVKNICIHIEKRIKFSFLASPLQPSRRYPCG